MLIILYLYSLYIYEQDAITIPFNLYYFMHPVLLDIL